MTLQEGSVGSFYKVEAIHTEESVERRLGAIGLNPMTQVQIVNRKRNGSMIIRVRGTRWAMGKAITNGILVREADRNE